MIHHHIITALNTALSYYLDSNNEQQWKALLVDTAHDDALLGRVYREIQEKPPQVRPHASAGNSSLPLIVVQQQSRRVIHRPLGGTVGTQESTISRQEAQIEIMAAGADVADVLAVTVLKSLQQFRRDFMRNGYLSYQVNGLSDLAPNEQLAAEELGIFMRRLDLEAMLQDEVVHITQEVILGPLTIGLVPTGRVSPI